MARLPRLLIPDNLHHVVQRCHDGMQLFREKEDYVGFMHNLQQGLREYKLKLHAYVLLPERIHLLLTPQDALGVSKLLQSLGRYYVPYYNKKYQRTGSLWQARYVASVLEAQTYFLPCSVYIEESPLRAGLANEACAYAWSSYAHHIGTRIDPLITDHPLFWALGNTPFQREANYKELMQRSLSANQRASLEQSTKKAWVLGSEMYQKEMEKLTQRRVTPAARGRPRKRAEEK